MGPFIDLRCSSTSAHLLELEETPKLQTHPHLDCHSQADGQYVDPTVPLC